MPARDKIFAKPPTGANFASTCGKDSMIEPKADCLKSSNVDCSTVRAGSRTSAPIHACYNLTTFVVQSIGHFVDVEPDKQVYEVVKLVTLKVEHVCASHR